jgi:chromosome partitioning protein
MIDLEALWDQYDGLLSLAGIIVGAFATGVSAGWFLRGWWSPKDRSDAKRLETLLADRGRRVDELEKVEAHYSRIERALHSSDEELWSLKAPKWPNRYLERLGAARAKILTIANLKGGVGKTTLAANLAAYFSRRRNQRVLIFDMDFQGSLSNLLQRAVDDTDVRLRLDRWLARGTDTRLLVDSSCNLNACLPATRLVTATYELTPFENRLMSQWLFAQGDKDERYFLAEHLLGDAVQSQFDVVIIDAPPRLSISAINALAASTHLIVPTIADRLSSDAVRTFLQMTQSLRGALFPRLEFAGVVLTMTTQIGLTTTEQAEVTRLRRDLNSLNLASPAHFFDRNIPDRAAIAQASSHGIAYVENSAVREIFNSLGDEIARRVGMQ